MCESPISPDLLGILACPACEERPPVELGGEGQWLRCTKCGRRYPVRDGIPVMLVDEALPAEDAGEREA
jgi:uncharacterized protein YbaR (Trm112 family)